ncbi:MAG: YihY/virulence factor BrkB family protein [Chloroflexota bacterium]|nr:YihY/virulence factor BrkB family protein [Lentimicrobium sp.]
MKKLFEQILDWITNLYKGFISSKIVSVPVGVTKRITLPGFEKVPIYDVAVFFFNGVKKGDLNTRAAALAYNSFLAIFPAIIFFFTLIPYIPIHNFQDSLLALLQDFIPRQTYMAVQETLFDIIKRPRGGLLSIGFLMAMYFATNSVNSMIDAFNKTYYTIETRTAFRQRILSIFLVIVLSFLVILAISLITFGPIVINWVERIGLLTDWLTLQLIGLAKWLVTLTLLLFAFSVLYYFAIPGKHRYRFITAGSTLTTFLFIITSVGFNYYVNNFASYNTLYGSIGTLIIFMLWLYFNSLIILIGWELNSSISVARRSYNSL